VGPSQPDKVVHQGLRKKSHLLIGHNRRRAVALAQPRLVGTEDHGDMSEQRYFKAQCLVKEDLAGSVIDMVIPANDMGDPHLGVIHDNSEIVGRIAVRPFNDQIV